jgi:hypothetical protein
MMPTLKGTAAYDALKASKDWTRFCKRRDELRGEYLAEGNTKTDAATAAAAQALREFGVKESIVERTAKAQVKAPAKKSAEKKANDEDEEPPDDPEWAAKRISMRKSVEWVFAALGRQGVKKSDAPDPGAWALLQWVGEGAANRGNFYSTFASKLLPTRTQIDVEGQREDDGGDISASVLGKIFGTDPVLSGGPSDAGGEPSLEEPDGPDGEDGPEGGGCDLEDVRS